ncbi:hypothetical protein [Faecalicatena contorta]|uniref:Uncharacterized protein n=1 Tax=Faecalicatena contorta TaxID=39482 RepID=A0A316A441_9FIRM|nr:hypothetical protein [Faecalicatena contorta]PWJ51554.1 hypothetical protein A8805_102328 [Faecalicatena contorta]SUQ13110.1 hypothetical protein SAMN05216529_102328 [Faecalicatena contorta]
MLESKDYFKITMLGYKRNFFYKEAIEAIIEKQCTNMMLKGQQEVDTK